MSAKATPPTAETGESPLKGTKVSVASGSGKRAGMAARGNLHAPGSGPQGLPGLGDQGKPPASVEVPLPSPMRTTQALVLLATHSRLKPIKKAAQTLKAHIDKS